MAKRWMTWALITILAVCLTAIALRPAAAFDLRPSPSFQADIERARASGAWQLALGRAQRLLQNRRSDPRTKPYALKDAQLQVATIQDALRLTEAQRRELTASFQLDPIIRRAVDDRLATAESLATLQREIRARLLGPEHHETAAALGLLANAHLDRPAWAEPLLREALRIDTQVFGSRSPAVAHRTLDLGRMYEISGDREQAGRYYGETYRLYRALGCEEDSTYSEAMFAYAIYKEIEGDMLAGEAYLREAVRSARKHRGLGSQRTQLMMRFLAVVLVDQAMYIEAEDLYRLILRLHREQYGPDHELVLGDLRLLTHLYRYQGRYLEAETLARDVFALAHRLFAAPDRRVLEADLLMGVVLRERGLLEESARFFDQVLARAPAVYGPAHPAFAGLLWEHGLLLQERGDWAAALAEFDRATQMLRDSGGNLIGPYYLCMLASLGTAQLALHQAEAAAPILEEAVVGYETHVAGMAGGYQRISTSLLSPYPAFALTNLELGRTEEAWAAMEKGHGRMLGDLLELEDQEPGSIDPCRRSVQDSLSQRILDIKTWIGMIEQLPPSQDKGGTRRIDAARDSLFAAQTARRLLQADAERPKTPEEASRRVTLADVQGTLDPRTALVGWLEVEIRTGERVRWVYVIRDRGGVSWERLPRLLSVGPPPGSSEAAAYRDMLARAPDPLRPDQDPAFADDLWRDWLSPIDHALQGVEELIVIPSAGLLGIPIEVIRDESGEILGDRFAISYVSSATNHVLLRRRAGKGEPPAASLLIGDPLLGGSSRHAGSPAASSAPPRLELLRGALRGDRKAIESLPALPASRRELSSVAALYPPATILVGEGASERSIFEMAQHGSLDQFGLIHLATHAIVDEEDPEGSALVLTLPAAPNLESETLPDRHLFDGLLRVEEIYHAWKLRADLVTLSACETALGRKLGDEGYLGFAHAFLRAGARSLILSLWKVDDEATALLMERFYENRAGARGRSPMNKSEALRDAKRWLRSYRTPDGRRPYEHPYYWASFILFGDSGTS